LNLKFQPRGIFPTSRRLQQERKAAAAVQQLIARRQPQSFALPSSLDLQRLRASADNFIVDKFFFYSYWPLDLNWDVHLGQGSSGDADC
jgi:hypothetical protein